MVKEATSQESRLRKKLNKKIFNWTNKSKLIDE